MPRWSLLVLAIAACDPADAAGTLSARRDDGAALESSECVLSQRASHFQPNGLYVSAVMPLPEGGRGSLRMDIPRTKAFVWASYSEDGPEPFHSTAVQGTVEVEGSGGRFDLAFFDGNRKRTLAGTFDQLDEDVSDEVDAELVVDDEDDDMTSTDDGSDDDSSDSDGTILRRPPPVARTF